MEDAVMFPVRSTAAFCAMLWGLLWFVTPPAPAADDPGRELLALVNQEREVRHLIPLARSAPLAAVAHEHALDLARRGELSHTDEQGRSPRDRVQAAGIDGFRLLAENAGRTTVQRGPLQAIVSGWLGSTAHRENLLNPAFNTTGLAIAAAADGELFAVQLFATFGSISSDRKD
jgi:uncharacterized protein YkwD